MSEYFENENNVNNTDSANNANVNNEGTGSVNNNPDANAQSGANENYSHSYTWNSSNAYNAQNSQYSQNSQNYQNQNNAYNPYNQYGNVNGGMNDNKPPKKKKEKKGISGSVVAILVLLCLIISVGGAIGGTLFAVNKLIDKNQDGGETLQSEEKKESKTEKADEDDEDGEKEVSADEKEEAVIIKSEGKAREVLDGTVASAAEKAYDSVVVITTETIEYDTFYGQYINSGAGSGVIISENGYIITCAHVIEGASTVTVTTTDGTNYNATIIGYDDQTDIGVIKIDADNLTNAVIGDSDTLVIGETVVAIGNPLGTLGGTVTSGIVSALDREIEIDGTPYHLLQTNAEINPGNSGGGLFNIDGELIGVVNAKSSGTGVEGLGFAIPVNEGIDIAQQLINNGYIKGRPAMGISVVEVSDYNDLYSIRSNYPKLLNYITDYGVYITEWTNGDFAFGDRIIAIDDESVSSYSDIKSILSSHDVGDKITVTVARFSENSMKSKMTDVELTLIESVPEN